MEQAAKSKPAFEFTSVTVTFPTLAPGELWAGVVTTEKGMHHVILLPGDQKPALWKKQMAWAESIGGVLPDRLELALLRRTLPEQFECDWYWSSETHAEDSGDAWVQHFDSGVQGYYDKDGCGRARAVRRLPI